jgi:hypothetical protein
MPSSGYAAPNPVQRAINAKWAEMAKKEGHVDYLVVNGEAIEGEQRANKGKECWTTDLNKQLKAAADLVNMIDYDKLLVTYGTEYHTGSNPNLDEMFATQMKAAGHGWELHFKPTNSDSIFHIAHQIGTSVSAWQFRTTGIARELVMALLNERELYKYRGIIRSHAHYYVSVAFTESFGIVTPCWQSRTPYQIRKGLALVPKLGYVVLEGLDDGQWLIRPETFDLPRPELVEV